MENQEFNYAKASTDSLLLAASANSDKKMRLLDAGCGPGTVALRILARNKNATAIGVDISKDAIKACGTSDRFTARTEDIFNPSAWLKGQTFDFVLTNPPYHKGRLPPSPARASARFEDRPLTDWIEACARRVRSKGKFAIVHKAERLGEIFCSLERLGFGAIEVFPYSSFAGDPASRIVVRAIKSSKSPLKLHAPVALHNPDGSWTAEALQIIQSSCKYDTSGI